MRDRKLLFGAATQNKAREQVDHAYRPQHPSRRVRRVSVCAVCAKHTIKLPLTVLTEVNVAILAAVVIDTVVDLLGAPAE